MKHLIIGIVFILWGSAVVSQVFITGNLGSFSSPTDLGVLIANALGVALVAVGINSLRRWKRNKDK